MSKKTKWQSFKKISSDFKGIDGWRTLLAGVGLIMVGVWEMHNNIQDEGLNHILLGIGLLGLGKKLDSMHLLKGKK